MHAYNVSSGALMANHRMFVRYMVHPSGAQMKNREGKQKRQQVGSARILRARFKRQNYPCSLVPLSKQPFFFTAPHKEPFDIFLMESAKPTFGSRHLPFPATHNPVKRHTSWLRTVTSPRSCVSPMNPVWEKKKKFP